MIKQQLMWTVLPKGKTFVNGIESFQFSIFLTPKLISTEITDENLPQQLSELPLFYYTINKDHKNWIDRIEALNFEVRINGSDRSTKVEIDKNTIDPRLWGRYDKERAEHDRNGIFNGHTKVKPFIFRDLYDKKIRSYPVKGVVDFVKGCYSRIGVTSPGSLPGLQPEYDENGQPVDSDKTLADLIEQFDDFKKQKSVLAEKAIDDKIKEELELVKQNHSPNDVDKKVPQAVIDVLEVDNQKIIEFVWSKSYCKSVDEYTLIVCGPLKGQGNRLARIFLEDIGNNTLQIYEYIDFYDLIDHLFSNGEKVMDPKTAASEFGIPEDRINFLLANRFYNRKKHHWHKKMEPRYPVDILWEDGHTQTINNKEEMDLAEEECEKPNQENKCFELVHPLTYIMPDHSEIYLQSKDDEHLLRRWYQDNTGYHNPFESEVPMEEFDFHQMLAIMGDYQMLLRKLGFIIDFSIPASKISTNDDETLSISVKKTNIDIHQNLYEEIFPVSRCMLKDGLIYLRPREDSGITDSGFLDLENGRFNLVQQDTDGTAIKLTNAARSIKRQVRRKYLRSFSRDELVINCQLDISMLVGVFETENVAPEPSFSLQDGVHKIADIKEALERGKNEKHRIYIHPDSIITRVKPNVWQIQTNNKKYELERTDNGNFHLYSLNRVALDTPMDAGLPALSSAGIALIQSKRADSLSEDFKTASDNNNGNPIELYAEDLLRGYRVDIKCDDEEWRSLCCRDGRYKYAIEDENGNKKWIKLEKHSDEGYVKSASVSSEEGVEDEVYAHESLLHWTGWSLVAPRPGKTIVTVKNENSIEEIVDDSEPVIGEKLSVDFNATQGSLPRLRFGKNYKVRVRTVDLAGNSLPHDVDSEDKVKEIKYQRFEPVLTPTLYPREKYVPGESAERMVIRTLNEFVEPSDETDERHVVPPKTSQLMAETHGVFDDLFSQKKYKEAFELAKKEAGKLDDDDEWNEKNQIKNENHYERISDGDESYILIKDEQVKLPYLPDVLAKGAVLQNVPGAGEHVNLFYDDIDFIRESGLGINALRIPFNVAEEWTADAQLAQTFRIKTLDSENTEPYCKWDKEARVLYIGLPKGRMYKIRYSSYFDRNDLDMMGIWDWLGRPEGAVKAFALAGCHWMLTPYRELTLVHAVQKPLVSPVVDKIEAKKTLGNTYVDIEGEFNLDIPSTGKIAILANWEEMKDDIEKVEPEELKVENSLAFEMNILEEMGVDTLKLPLAPCSIHRHEFGDTKHRVLNYYLLATSRFTEYFEPESDLDHTLTGIEPKKVMVLNSARPAAPKVNYMIPTFTWEEKRSNNIIKRKRKGGGLRVYLERPWYSSGNGELLAVTLPKGPLDESVKPFVTQWGLDPVHDSPLPKSRLDIKDDFETTISHENLSLDEVKERVADVAAFKTEYDKDKKFWYADIKVNMEDVKSYFPFIQLALARYQPNSVEGAHLSRIEQTDPIQLPNDRELTAEWVMFSKTRSRALKLQLKGYAPIKTKAGQNENLVKFSLQYNKGNELEWQDIGEPKTIEAHIQDNLFTWEDSISENDLKSAMRPLLQSSKASAKFRILVTEYEQYLNSDGETVERLVYADEVGLAIGENGVNFNDI